MVWLSFQEWDGNEREKMEKKTQLEQEINTNEQTEKNREDRHMIDWHLF